MESKKIDLEISKYKNIQTVSERDEVIRIHSIFFEKSYPNQRKVIRLLMWWCIKHYFKILFK